MEEETLEAWCRRMREFIEDCLLFWELTRERMDR